ncbi:hypothetical protein SK128_025233 [Halocaridina rubra]|uniref:Uncharacterized protein n=1 Tax=Halocaridina rubra TaxID=373956 RepID=A0AAN8W9Z9_HALRR
MISQSWKKCRPDALDQTTVIGQTFAIYHFKLACTKMVLAPMLASSLITSTPPTIFSFAAQSFHAYHSKELDC